MKLLNLNKFKTKKTNLIIGFFDGVHKGHQKLINRAMNSWVKVIVLTFDRKLNSDQKLQTHDQKIKCLKNKGAAEIISLSMDEVKNYTPDEFIKKYLIPLNINKIFVGEGFRFAKNRSGTIDDLKRYFKVKTVPLYKKNNKPVSSTFLKSLLTEGKVEEYKKYTGNYYRLEGKVVQGKGIATKLLNTPTANVETGNMFPRDGVYAAMIRVNDHKKYKGIAIFSKSPTFTNNKISRLEVHIFNFSKNIYNQHIKVEIIAHIRDIFALPTAQALKNQIYIDIKKSKLILKNKTTLF